MPATADRLFEPLPDAAPRHPLLAALTVTASVAVHGVALAAAIGFWGTEDTVPPQPFEVVMVTVTRPNPIPAPEAAGDTRTPERAETGDPPAAAVPLAETVSPAIRAPRPVSAEVSAPPARSAATPPPTRGMLTEAPPPAAVAETAVQVARVEEIKTPQPAAEPSALATPPRPVTRPAATRASAQPAEQRLAALPPPRPTSGTSSSSPGTAPAKVSGGISSPAGFSLGSAGNPAPDYPFRARQRGWEGRVVLRVAVDRQGHPVRIDVVESSGHGVLDQAAHRTIVTWIFRPALSGGEAVAGATLVPIVFRLN